MRRKKERKKNLRLSNQANLINLKSERRKKKPKQDASITSHHPLISEVINELCLNFFFKQSQKWMGREDSTYDECDYFSYAKKSFFS